jgi:hypothetical protein
MNVKHKLIFLSSAFTCVVTGFLIVMHFRHDPHWPASRFGGTPGALALIPVCLISYAVGCFYVNRWLHPKVFPGLRAAIPRPTHDAYTSSRKPLRTILYSGIASLISGTVLLIHFSQPSGTDVPWEVNLGALLCIPIFLISMGFCVHTVNRWHRARQSVSSTSVD